MAKAKKDDTNTTEVKDDLLSSLEAKYGKGIFTEGAYVAEKKRRVIPFSPQFDIMLNGGIREGSFIVSTGKPKIGKSSSSLDFASSALECPSEKHGDRTLYIFNIEGRLNPRDLVGIKGLRKYVEDAARNILLLARN